MGNYEIMADQNRKLFLTYDQNVFIKKFHLEHDDRRIFFRMLGKTCVLERATGYVTMDGKPAGVNASMSVYDLFCHSTKPVALAGRWVGLSDLGGFIASSHISKMKDPDLTLYAGKTAAIEKACEDFGGIKKEQGDVSFVLPVFEFFPVWFQFWDADDEFPPSLTFLWDANALKFLHYETLWYVMGFIQEELKAAISNSNGPF